MLRPLGHLLPGPSGILEQAQSPSSGFHETAASDSSMMLVPADTFDVVERIRLVAQVALIDPGMHLTGDRH